LSRVGESSHVGRLTIPEVATWQTTRILSRGNVGRESAVLRTPDSMSLFLLAHVPTPHDRNHHANPLRTMSSFNERPSGRITSATVRPWRSVSRGRIVTCLAEGLIRGRLLGPAAEVLAGSPARRCTRAGCGATSCPPSDLARPGAGVGSLRFPISVGGVCLPTT
jgi:hypothetical protein